MGWGGEDFKEEGRMYTGRKGERKRKSEMGIWGGEGVTEKAGGE